MKLPKIPKSILNLDRNTASSVKIRRALNCLGAISMHLNTLLIEAGRGSQGYQDILAEADRDPLCGLCGQVFDLSSSLRAELVARWGPGAA